MSDIQPEVTTTEEVRVRRAPRYARFIILGGALGAVVTIALTLAFEPDPQVGYAALVGYFLLFGIPAGVLLGCLVALILDAASRRRARSATAEHTVTEAAPVEGELLD